MQGACTGRIFRHFVPKKTTSANCVFTVSALVTATFADVAVTAK